MPRGSTHDAVDRSRYLTFRQLLELLPGWTRSRLVRRITCGRFPARRRIGTGHWLYSRAEAEIEVRRLLAEDANTKLTKGETDALASRMLLEGATDGRVVMELRLPLTHVRALRSALGLAPMAPPAVPAPPASAVHAVAPPVVVEPASPSSDAFWASLQTKIEGIGNKR